MPTFEFFAGLLVAAMAAEFDDRDRMARFDGGRVRRP